MTEITIPIMAVVILLCIYRIQTVSISPLRPKNFSKKNKSIFSLIVCIKDDEIINKIPDEIKDSLARMLYESMKKYYNTKEGRDAFAEWKKKKELDSVNTEVAIHIEKQGED